VIASEKSVEYFQNLEILKSDIADNKNNATKFVYVTKGKLKNKTSEVVSIAFTFGLDKSGSLFEVTKIFAKAKVNLTKIESRPTKDASGNYVFYLDFEANLKDKKTKDLLKSVKAITKDFKIIGVV
jgi:prephenate dehydratase